MSSFYSLLECLSDYFFENKCWPYVKISPTFWVNYADRITLLREDGIQIEVAERLRGKHCFVISQMPDTSMNEVTEDDLNSYIALFVSEVKGDGPILNMNPRDLQICPN